MFHGGLDRHFVATSVATSGRSLNLGKGVFAVIDTEAPVDNNGLKITDNFQGLAKDHKVQLFSGSPDLGTARTYGNKSSRSIEFAIEDIKELRVSAPKEGIHVDEQILGYDGHNADTAIVLEPGDNEEISVKLSGPGLAFAGYQDSEVIITDYLTAPNTPKATDQTEADNGAWTDHQIVEEAVERLKEKVVMGGVPLSDFVEVTPVNSANGSASGSDTVFFNLVLDDKGTYTDLGAVQAQYPSLDIKRTDVGLSGSTYTAIAEIETVTAGDFVTGQQYTIVTAGDTDFTAVGAADSNPGTTFVATGAGTGTGTAEAQSIADYQINKKWLVKGCADCPSGYTEYSDGFVYSVGIEDDNADSTTAVEAISSNVTADSAVKVNAEGGFSTYTFVTSEKLTEAEKDAFIASNEEAVIQEIAPDVAELCSPDNIETVAWTQGETCKTQTETYSIIVGHDECGNAPTAEIQAAYPELTIVEGDSENCSTAYTTTVTTNVVCEECSEQFRDIFTSEAPKSYGVNSWTKEDPTYSQPALMGIRFKAKPFIFAGSEEYRDYVPELATSTRIQVAGGYSVTVTESFENGSTDGRYKVTILSTASEPENWGLNLRDWEEGSRLAFQGQTRFYQNNYGNFVTGMETNLDAVQPYVDYVLKVRRKTSTQTFFGENNETVNYHVLVAPGAHIDVENVLNALAAEAGKKTVQAFGNTSA